MTKENQSTDHLQTLLAQAVSCHRRGDLQGAERAYSSVISINPEHFDALHFLGAVKAQAGQAEEAVALITRALAIVPDYADAHINLGSALRSLNRVGEAIDSYRKALALKPDYADAHYNLGNALNDLNRAGEAIDCYRKALAIKPDFVQAHNNLGNALNSLGRFEEAIDCLHRALALKPDLAAAHNNLGNALESLNRSGEAIDCYRQALALKPDYADAHNNLGSALKSLNRIGEALDCYRKALALKPDFADAHYNLGNALDSLNRSGEAIDCYRQALAFKPDFAEAHNNLALALLFQQRFEAAWPLYEQRLNAKSMRDCMREDEASVVLFKGLVRWRGPAQEPGHTVAIWGEQGIGDQVLFSTLIPELIDAGTSFIYEVDPRLLAAYERSFPGRRFVPQGDPPQAALQQAERVLWAGSLPGLFRTSRADFARQPRRLLQALPERVIHYRSRLEALGAGPKVAFSWQSMRKDRLGPKKSAPLAQFAPLLALAGVHFVDVQYGDTGAERQELERAAGVRLLHFDEVDYFNDLEELLAILEACDLLITTSNVNAHLAGALGKRAWILYPADRPPFHYWAHDGDYRCHWYPSVESVTAPGIAEWSALVQHAADKWQRTTPVRFGALNAP